MTLFLHIAAALSSLVYTAFACIAPSWLRLRITVTLIVLTLGSGAYLIWNTHSPMLAACTTGLGYLALVLSGFTLARYRLLRTTTHD